MYRNEDSIAELLQTCEDLNQRMGGDLEAVFVVDGSPDRCLELLQAALPEAGLRSQLIVLSRNFGSFAAVLAGLTHARGSCAAVMAADLQEPPELMLQFRELLETGRYDVVLGTRRTRADGWLKNLCSSAFWRFYCAWIQREMPPGGVDVFACSAAFRDELSKLDERNTTLVGLACWLGFRRGEVSYERRPRRSGRSAWTFARRVRYLLDSTFAFSDWPLRLLSVAGIAGVSLSILLGVVVLVARARGDIPVPGYAATVLTVVFFGGLNSLGLGLIGEYLWRTFENTKGRPTYVVARRLDFRPGDARE